MRFFAVLDYCTWEREQTKHHHFNQTTILPSYLNDERYVMMWLLAIIYSGLFMCGNAGFNAINHWNSLQCAQASSGYGSNLTFEDTANCDIHGLIEQRSVPLANVTTFDWQKYPCLRDKQQSKVGCMFGSTKFRFLYIVNSKVISKSIIDILKHVFRDDLDIRSCDRRPLHNNYDDNTITNDFQSYFVFTFVRDPLERFRSTYYQFMKRKDAQNPLIDPVSITELLQDGFVVDTFFRSQSYNLINDIANLTFIGKYERFRVDWEIIETKIFQNFPNEKDIKREFKHKRLASPYYHAACKFKCDDVILSEGNPKFMANFCPIYQQDYACLGYPLPELCQTVKENALDSIR